MYLWLTGKLRNAVFGKFSHPSNYSEWISFRTFVHTQILKCSSPLCKITWYLLVTYTVLLYTFESSWNYLGYLVLQNAVYRAVLYWGICGKGDKPVVSTDPVFVSGLSVWMQNPHVGKAGSKSTRNRIRSPWEKWPHYKRESENHAASRNMSHEDNASLPFLALWMEGHGSLVDIPGPWQACPKPCEPLCHYCTIKNLIHRVLVYRPVCSAQAHFKEVGREQSLGTIDS